MICTPLILHLCIRAFLVGPAHALCITELDTQVQGHEALLQKAAGRAQGVNAGDQLVRQVLTGDTYGTEVRTAKLKSEGASYAVAGIVASLVLFAMVLAVAVASLRGSDQRADKKDQRAHSAPKPRAPPSSDSSLTSAAPSCAPISAPSYPPSAASSAWERHSAQLKTQSSIQERHNAQLKTPLCAGLVVPEASCYRCVLPDVVSCTRQTLTQSISSIPPPGSESEPESLLQLRIAEQGRAGLNSTSCGIFLEQVNGCVPLGFLSTHALWSLAAGVSPRAILMRPGGSEHAVLLKSAANEYTVSGDFGVIATFKGNFAERDVQVTNCLNQMVVRTSKNSQCGYEVIIGSKVDAGLIILCLLGIDKIESIQKGPP